MFVYQQLDGFPATTGQLFMYKHSTLNRNEYKEIFHNNLCHWEGLHSGSFHFRSNFTSTGEEAECLEQEL
jgi:hypothetical protein